MAKPKVTPFDKFVGERVREARLTQRMSQQALAQLLGVSFQQVQKYEQGVNRVSGSRFELLVRALNRPLTYFFPNESDVRSTADPIMSQFIASKRGLDMAKNFPRLNAGMQDALLKVMHEALATKEQG